MDPLFAAVLERKRRRLFGQWSPGGKRGVEIGPLNRPLVRREDGDVLYVDHCSTEELRIKYQKEEDNTDLVDIDLVWGEETLAGLLGLSTQLDYIVASHVIEHVPDLCGWLHEMHDALTPGGRLLLVIPDKRFTFDIYRSVTNPQEMREAWRERRRRPGSRLIADHFANVVQVDTWALWDDYSISERLEYFHTPEFVDLGLRHFHEGKYVDIHCWVFTPWHFMRLMGLMSRELGLSFELSHFLTTQDHDLEFYVQLVRKTGAFTDWEAEARKAEAGALWPASMVKHQRN